jgi:hypothetical protein
LNLSSALKLHLPKIQAINAALNAFIVSKLNADPVTFMLNRPAGKKKALHPHVTLRFIRLPRTGSNRQPSDKLAKLILNLANFGCYFIHFASPLNSTSRFPVEHKQETSCHSTKMGKVGYTFFCASYA